MFKSTAVKSKNQLSKKQSFIMTHHFIPIRMAVSEKKTNKIQVLVKTKEIRTLVFCW